MKADVQSRSKSYDAEPSHARERRWPADFEINVNSRRPVMRVVRQFNFWLHEVTMLPNQATPLALTVALFLAIFGHALAQDSPDPQPPAVRVALDGDCCVSLVEMHAYVKGEEAFSSQWRGLRYLFLSEEEKLVFDSNPERYAVASGGLDIVATYGLEGPLEGVKKIYGSGRNSHRFEDETYHFATTENFRLFTKNAREFVIRAKQAAYLQAEAKRGKTLAELYPNK